jgi:hypothetical protein
MKKLIFTSLATMLMVGGAYAADGDIASVGYVNSGLVQKQNKIAGAANQVVVATGTSGTVAYRDIASAITLDSTGLADTGLATAGAVAAALANAIPSDYVTATQVATDIATATSGKANASEVYTKTEADTATSTAISNAISSLDLENTYLTVDDIANKADKATTLAGYGITDAMEQVNCASGQMLIANAEGNYVCVNVETGTYVEAP